MDRGGTLSMPRVMARNLVTGVASRKMNLIAKIPHEGSDMRRFKGNP